MGQIIGVDEVGRGCWAGPLVAGAVLMERSFEVPEGAGWRLGDSKKLTKLQREIANGYIQTSATAFSLGWVSAEEVDQLGLTKAVGVAMERAVAGILHSQGRLAHEEIIIDGNINFLPDNPLATCLVKADDSVPAVSAASILAKVARDTFMTEQALQYPGYGFERHVGYGTKHHQEALKQFGITPLHRKSYKPVAKYV